MCVCVTNKMTIIHPTYLLNHCFIFEIHSIINTRHTVQYIIQRITRTRARKCLATVENGSDDDGDDNMSLGDE